MSDPALSEAEARVLWTVLHKSWIPGQYLELFQSAMHKLCVLGKGFACRDCSNPGTKSSRYGGFVCVEHEVEEAMRFAQAENKERK